MCAVVFVVCLSVAIVRDCDYSLRSIAEPRVEDEDRHGHDEPDQGGAQDVDDQALLEHLHGVGLPERVHPGEGAGGVEPGVDQVGHPFRVGDAV